MKHLLKWVIPTVVLLLIGMWIGLNWHNFPANEEVFIPVVQKNEVKYDTAINSSVEDTTTNSSVETEPITSSVMDSLYAMEDEKISEEDLTVEQEEPSTIEPEAIAAPAPQTAAPKKQLIARIQHTNPENGRRPNQNLTPSVIKVVEKKPINKPTPKEDVAPKNEIVYDSYMSRKEIPVDNLVKVDGTYKPGESGKGISEATFIVYNVTGKNLKKVNMEVQYLDKNNQLLNKLEMPVTNISAEGSVNVKLPANANANRLVYKVLYVSSALGDFYYEPLTVYASALR